MYGNSSFPDNSTSYFLYLLFNTGYLQLDYITCDPDMTLG